MWSWFQSDPVKRLEKQYARKLSEAKDLQRAGDIIGYADVSDQAQQILEQIEAIEAKSAAGANR